MTERKNIKVDTETYQKLRAEKRSIETWADLFDRLLEGDDGDGDTTDAGLPDDLREQLDRIEAAASTTEARTGSIESTLEQLGGR